MNRLDSETRARILTALIEGNSIASACRMTGVAKMTVLSLIGGVGAACQRFHDARVRYLTPARVQCDEVWSYCYSKQKNVPAEFQNVEGYGSIWTWTALDADSKLIISWLASSRGMDAAQAFINDLKDRTVNHRFQMTTDGRPEYLLAVVRAFRDCEIDYAELLKVYGSSGSQPGSHPKAAESRYSPGRLLSIEKIPRVGMPLDKYISTSYMERWNLTIRMQNRRFTRLTNAFSKKFENHQHMLALSMVYYNFCRKHRSLGRRTPADGGRPDRLHLDRERSTGARHVDRRCYKSRLKLDHYRSSA